MAISAPEATNEEEECREYGESETEEGGSDDSEEDPTYDIVKKIRLSLSKLSVKKSKSRSSKTSKEEDSGNEEDLDFTEVKRSKSRTSKTSKEEDSGNEEDLDFTKVKRSKPRTSKTSKEEDSGNEEDLDFTEVKVPKLNKEEEKCFETVEKIIQAGQLEKLKVDQCKVYLRKYGLRLTGKKDVLIGRIKERLEVVDGSGEKRYPVSSFVINCKGDACTGDVVMFEQKVYEMYNIASRSATAPPCGTRIVAGRIVKESYGAAKQQHTFTIEVLWSRGEKVLPPLHPLLIKGRNLYRLHTMRQPWVDEDERKKVLREKHTRGFIARTSRDLRTKEKEMRKTMTSNKRMQRKESYTKPTQEKCNQQLRVPTQVREDLQLNIQEENLQADIQRSPYRFKENWPPNIQRRSPIRCNEIWQQDILVQLHKNGWASRNPLGAIDYNKIWQQDILIQQHNNGWASRNPVGFIEHNNMWQHDILVPQHKNGWAGRNQVGAIDHRQHFHEQKQTDIGFHHHRQLVNGLVSQQQIDAGFHHRQLAKGPVSQQWCPYYPQGRCRFGDSCKFLHE